MRRRHRVGRLAVTLGFLLVLCASMLRADEPPIELGDVINGWQVFHEKRCVRCHAVWGQGSQIGPDLGRAFGGPLTASELAGRMWNHVPRMVALMRQYQLPEMTLTRAEMADMFSFLYFVRYLDEPGDPREGRRILSEKRCTECHTLERGGGETGPDLTRWAGFVNPIVWAQMMWEHGAGMEEAMKQANIEWPELGDADLANIIAFVRSVGTSAQKVYLRPGSPARGRGLFAERGCAACHTSAGDASRKGPDPARIELPGSLSALASRMWNHLPAMHELMARQELKPTALSAQEMADIIAYLFAMQYEGEPGDAARGKRVFAAKRCVDCHELPQILAAETGGAGRGSAVGMGHAIWQHGAAMADQMTKAGIPWPTFEGDEMADLIAYVRSAGDAAGEKKTAEPAETGPAETGNGE
jgi:cytochrome c2